jgi:hypothetical protein
MYYSSSINIKLIEALENRFNLDLGWWLAMLCTCVRLDDRDCFLYCLQQLNKIENIYSVSFQLIKDQNEDEENLTSTNNNWVLFCISYERFHFLESVFGDLDIYGLINDKFWIHSICYRFRMNVDHTQDKCYLSRILEKYSHIYEKNLVPSEIIDELIDIIISTNDLFVFSWVEKAIRSMDDGVNYATKEIIFKKSYNLYRWFIINRIQFDELLSENEIFYSNIDLFSYLLNNRHLFNVDNESIWNNVLKSANLNIIELCKQHIKEYPAYFCQEFKSVEVVQTLIKLGIKFEPRFICLKNHELLIWMIDNNFITYSNLPFDIIYYEALTEKDNKLFNLIRTNDDLEKAMWYFINPRNYFEIDKVIRKHYVPFLKKCLSFCEQLPDIEPHISDIINFTSESNSIKIITMLSSMGYELTKFESFSYRLLHCPHLMLYYKYKVK